MDVKTIVITGPESCGKTTLASQLASQFSTVWNPEFARSYIDQLDRDYSEQDLLEIAKGQVEAEKKLIKNSDKPVFLDTSLEVIKVWSDYKYGRCHPWIIEQLQQRKHQLYLLCAPDIPWQFDKQRESPNDRKKIFELYKEELTSQNTKFVLISGLNEQRTINAAHHVKSYFHIPRYANHA